MQKIVTKLTIFFLILANFSFLSPVLADTSLNTSSSFNPFYIISDNELQDWQSMTRGDIQAFLDNYSGTLSTLQTKDKNGDLKPAADIIYQAACDYKINPKYILVKLQKEQSLITNATPTERQLDFACGYGCPDSSGCSESNRGFGKQVDAAAGIMRWYYDNVNISSIVKKANVDYLIDGTLIHPLTFATAFLYTYTPHLLGNQNFWTLWQKWFQQIYPDGTLLKSAASSTVYLLRDGYKRSIDSMSVLVSLYDPKMIITAPESELTRYPNGNPITLPNYSILKNVDKYYLLDNETIRPFTSYDVVRKMGYQPEETIEVTDNDLVSYLVGQSISLNTQSPLGRLIKLKETNTIYYLNDDHYYPIIDSQIAKINFPNLTIEKGSVTDLNNLQAGPIIFFKDGTLVGIRGTSQVYVIEKGLKRHIPSEEIFNGLGYDWKNVTWVDETTIAVAGNGQPLFLRPDELNTNQLEETDANVSLNSVMQKVSSDKIKYVGKGEQFTTQMNNFLVADYATGKILAGKNVDEVRPLASFTKVMTAYELLNEKLNLSTSVKYNNTRDRATYGTFRIINGERIKNSDLLKSMLVSSVNTAAKILANQLGGEKTFIKKLNQLAKTWGLKNTTFVESYGYDLGNKSTPAEYLKIFTKALGNKTILNTLGLADYQYNEITDLDNNPRHFDQNSNKLVNKDNLGFNILASKTGYLNEAGSGLAMLVERANDKKKFVIITMGNPDYAHRFDDPEKLTNWALQTF